MFFLQLLTDIYLKTKGSISGFSKASYLRKGLSSWNTSIQKADLYPKLITQASILVNGQRQHLLGRFPHAYLKEWAFRDTSHFLPQKAVGHHPWDGSSTVKWTPLSIQSKRHSRIFLRCLAFGICMIIVRSLPAPATNDRANSRWGYCQKLVLAEQQSPLASQSSLSNQIMRKARVDL